VKVLRWLSTFINAIENTMYRYINYTYNKKVKNLGGVINGSSNNGNK